jgi:hypothetical protein
VAEMKIGFVILTMLIVAHAWSTNCVAQPKTDTAEIKLNVSDDRYEKCHLSILNSNNDSASFQLLDANGEAACGLSMNEIVVKSPRRGTAKNLSLDSTLFTTQPRLWVSFVLDNSISMYHSYDSLTKYLDWFVKGMHQYFSAVVFDNIMRDDAHLSTAKRDVFLGTLARTESVRKLSQFWHFYDTIRGNWTPLYDAIYAAIDPVLSAASNVEIPPDQRIIVVITDGADNASRIGLTDLAAVIKGEGLRLFAINFESEPDGRLEWLTHRGRGEYYYAWNLEKLRGILTKLRQLLFRTYIVHYKFESGGAGGMR